jgi:glycosyltransferase involved in cell wall biosynthesis
MTPPRFSIVIPTFNRSEYLGKAIESALNQTFVDLEVVVSDNHSTDDTPDVVSAIGDPRIRYVRPPVHGPMPDHWDFAWRQCTGDFILLMGDDDALIDSAVERFMTAQQELDADFLFCSIAEYLDPGFEGPRPNTLVCFEFSGESTVVKRDRFLGPLFRSLQPAYRMDPAAFVFSRALATRVAERCGRFFNTQGAEYFAWPLAAVFANRIVHVGTPLVLIGRTPKSWGTNMVLLNTGHEKIDTLLGDVITEWRQSPVTNFTFANLMVEGMLTAKSAFPEGFAAYDVSESAFMGSIYRELRARESQGVDVAEPVAELEAYILEHPSLGTLAELQRDGGMRVSTRVAAKARRIGARVRGTSASARRGFKADGSVFGFHDIVGAASVLSRAVKEPDKPPTPKA